MFLPSEKFQMGYKHYGLVQFFKNVDCEFKAHDLIWKHHFGKEGFIIYLLCHNRLPNEILKPNKRNMKSIFESESEGMSNENFSHLEYESTRDVLIDKIKNCLTSNNRLYLSEIELSFTFKILETSDCLPSSLERSDCLSPFRSMM